MRSEKPLGRKAYGSIPHLPGSRLGPADHHCHVGQEAICATKARDRHDRIIVTEKLDGSNVAVAKVGGVIFPLARSGYTAISSPHEQHHHFDKWVRNSLGLWSALLAEGEVIHGEWLALAHGTIYDLDHPPFVAFDITREGRRVPHDELVERAAFYSITTPHVVADGGPIAVADALARLGEFGRHGAREPVEGLVYRVERRGAFDFMAKFVRADKVDGKYLAGVSGATPYWHWRAA